MLQIGAVLADTPLLLHGARSPFPVRRREESGAPAEEGQKRLCRLSSQPRNAASVF